jgi:UDP-glucose 4-epimerase|tara:strand:- start:1852 stop:2829 length:978 start_codon:yes stop_codon:yes gene_type:complete
MKYLVTGGAGFIGSYLVEALLSMGHIVTIVDDMSTGTYNNIKPFKKDKNFSFVLGTILDQNLMMKLVSKCDQVFHLAAVVGVKHVMENPVDTIRTNTIGTENILHYCAKYNKKVLIASTSEVYGKAMKIKKGNAGLKESDDSLFGATHIRRWSYATSKALDEFLSLAYYQEKKLPVVIVRFFNTVGPRQLGEYGMVIPIFVHKALLGDTLPVFGDGNQRRSFTYVGDVVKGIIKLMDTKKAEGQVINIGNSDEITINELAKLVIKITKSKSQIEYIPYEKAYGIGFEDMSRRKPDISKINKLIGFQPTLGIEEIVEQVVKYMKSI